METNTTISDDSITMDEKFPNLNIYTICKPEYLKHINTWDIKAKIYTKGELDVPW